MADQVEILLPKTRHNEGTNFTATAYFRDRATKASSTPTTVHYRVDDLNGNTNITPWTSVSAAASVSISITPTMNAIQGQSNRIERKQLMVKADDGLSTQAIGSVIWQVKNLYGIGT